MADSCSLDSRIDCSLVLDTIPNGLFVVDHNGTICIWNRRMEELTGYSSDEAIGKPCSMLACGDGDTEDWVEKCPLLHGDETAIEGYECHVRHKQGDRIPIMKNAKAVQDDAGNVMGVVQTLTDLRPLRNLEAEVTALRQIAASSPDGKMVGKSHQMQQVYEQIRLAAGSEATILIFGETGTGKELAVEEIHKQSARSNGPLVKVNCSALSENLLESELFGHVKGAFTGAIGDKVGRFELADGGTIFLDEIGDISPLIQVKLLRVLQEKEIERVGEATPRKVNVRVIAATHRDLRALVDEEEFRQDLYYRLRVFPITMPPLRSRKEDIPMLVDHFIQRFREETGKQITGLSADANYAIMDACWPGNVRELENAIEHAFVTCQTDTIEIFDLPMEIRMSELRNAQCAQRNSSSVVSHVPQLQPEPPQRRKIRRKEELLALLHEHDWNKTEVARVTGMTRVTVWRKMKQWGIPLEPPKNP